MVAHLPLPAESCFSGQHRDLPDELAALAVGEVRVCNVGFCDDTFLAAVLAAAAPPRSTLCRRQFWSS